MNDEQWGERMVRSIGLLLNGDGLPDRDERGAPVRDDTFYALLHADPDGAEACIPGDLGTMWRIVFDTAHQVPFPDQGDLVPAGPGSRSRDARSSCCDESRPPRARGSR